MGGVWIRKEGHENYLDNGDSLDNFLLVHLGAGTVEVSHDVSHASLVPCKCGDVD
jgi:hypothetical protein